jgi:UDP:flavonoid glycosyltransferase YjiC (YdhE family)
MGTLAMDLAEGFHGRVIDALRPLDDVQAIVVAPERTVTAAPPRLLTYPRVPVLDLLPHLDAVVGHGGLNTVCETLAHGVPLVVAPVKDDQPINAARVVAAGAGIRVSFDRSGPDRLRAAVRSVLDDPAYRVAAQGIGADLVAAGGAPAAAARLEALACSALPLTTESERR